VTVEELEILVCDHLGIAVRTWERAVATSQTMSVDSILDVLGQFLATDLDNGPVGLPF